MSGARRSEFQLARFDEAIERLRARFPRLRIEIESGGPSVEASAWIPAQPPELLFDVGLNLQNIDELHLFSGDFWMSYFPCDEDPIFEEFVTCAIGLLSGEYRIVEDFVGRRHASAWLEKPTASGWVSVGGGGRVVEELLWKLLPWKRRREIRRNSPGSSQRHAESPGT